LDLPPPPLTQAGWEQGSKAWTGTKAKSSVATVIGKNKALLKRSKKLPV
jgi:hypothetical protein